ncbi:hypothetical protein ABK040_010179 [Willaertia magna]
MSSLTNRNSFQLLENKLSDDEKLIILSFLDIKTLCSLNCVSKCNFSLSKLCNNDKFWYHYYKKIINDYYNLDFNSVYFNGIDVNKIKTEKEILLNINENFKKNLILFFKNIFKQTRDLQQERLNNQQKNNANHNTNYNTNHVLLTKEMLLKENIDTVEIKDEYKIAMVGSEQVGKVNNFFYCLIINFDFLL